MLHVKSLRTLGALALLAMMSFSAGAQEIKTVFVIAMENHNWTQPANQFTGKIQQIYQNPNAPFINSLVNGTGVVRIDGHEVNISKEVAFAMAYHNVLATPTGNNTHVHPSEPNYLWAEAGDNFGIFNDADPFPNNNHDTDQHLATQLTKAHRTWKSYQEDIDLTQDATGGLTNFVLPRDQWTVPLTSHHGNFTAGLNQFNGSNQFDYAAKHNPMVFFTDTNGGNDPSTNNPLRRNYAPLQQLFEDLRDNRVADFNWITPNQHNDMHTSLVGGFEGLTGDAANLKQGDEFLRQIIPAIMASKAYQDGGVIILWWDESEQDGVANDNPDDFNHTIPEIVISKHAHKNVNGVPYASFVNFTHSSDLRTFEEIFHLRTFVGDAANSNDLSDLFQPGALRGDRDDDRGCGHRDHDRDGHDR